MMLIPDIPPKVTAVTFEVFRAGSLQPDGHANPEKKVFIYEPGDNIHGDALNDPTLDCNAYFSQITHDTTVTKASASISFDHSVRHLQRIPVGAELAQMQDICTHFGVSQDGMTESLGGLVNVMIAVMVANNEFANATPENNPILHVGALMGHGPDTPAMAPRP